MRTQDENAEITRALVNYYALSHGIGGEDTETHVAELVADLMIFAAKAGVDWEIVAERAAGYVEGDKEAEALCEDPR